ALKSKWILKKCAKFLFEQDLNNPENQDEETEGLDVSCKGAWKLYTGEHNDLVLSYLESDHFLLTKKDVVLESFSLPCSKSCLKGVAKADTLLMSCILQDGNTRQFRIQFDAQDGRDGIVQRKECTRILRKFIKILDYDDDEIDESKKKKLASIDEFVLNKMQCRKGYSVHVPRENLKQVLILCLTDNTFPAYVAEVSKLLKEITKEK
ncbi:unnamed protein product, partial [Larinioides sclopetarius]